MVSFAILGIGLVAIAGGTIIYGMFIAVVIPPAKKDRTLLVLVAVSFAVSGLVSLIPLFAAMSESLRIILLTLVISGAAALLRPVRDEEGSV